VSQLASQPDDQVDVAVDLGDVDVATPVATVHHGPLRDAPGTRGPPGFLKRSQRFLAHFGAGNGGEPLDRRVFTATAVGVQLLTRQIGEVSG
jgi:hypothetical protein